jgi:hypothetical protein
MNRGYQVKQLLGWLEDEVVEPLYRSAREYRTKLNPTAEKRMDTAKDAARRREEAQGVLSSPVNYEPPPEGAWLLDRALNREARFGHPGVTQTPIQRANPGPRQAIGSATRPWMSEPNVDLVRQQVDRGRLASGEEWYPSTYSIRAEMDEIGGNFDDFVWANAITSPQSSVPVNIPTATAVLTLQNRGLPLTTENLKRLTAEMQDKYGRQFPGFFAPQSRLDQYQKYLDEGRPPEGILSAEKITSYGEGLRGNLANVPLDTHELAGTSYGSTLYPHWKAEGSVPTGVYGPYEDAYRGVLMDMGLAPASGQASRWIGGGELTGLRTSPGTFADILEQVSRFSSKAKTGDVSREGARRQMRAGLLGQEPLVPVYSGRVMQGIDPRDYR